MTGAGVDTVMQAGTMITLTIPSSQCTSSFISVDLTGRTLGLNNLPSNFRYLPIGLSQYPQAFDSVAFESF